MIGSFWYPNQTLIKTDISWCRMFLARLASFGKFSATEKYLPETPWLGSMTSRKHTYIVLTPLNPTYIQ